MIYHIRGKTLTRLAALSTLSRGAGEGGTKPVRAWWLRVGC